MSGTEAPLVTPTVVTPSSHSSFRREALSMRWEASAPAARATSTSRTEFEELSEPTTITSSHSGAIVLTATWRLVVA